MPNTSTITTNNTVTLGIPADVPRGRISVERAEAIRNGWEEALLLLRLQQVQQQAVATASQSVAAASANDDDDDDDAPDEQANDNNNSDDEAVVVTTTIIDLSGHVWTVPALEVLEPVLKRHDVLSTAKTLKLDDVIAGLVTEVGLQTFRKIDDIFESSSHRVENVNLNDNAVGAQGLPQFRNLLVDNRRLRSLTLKNCGMSSETAVTLAEMIAPIASRFRELDLSRNQLGPDGAAATGAVLGR